MHGIRESNEKKGKAREGGRLLINFYLFFPMKNLYYKHCIFSREKTEVIKVILMSAAIRVVSAIRLLPKMAFIINVPLIPTHFATWGATCMVSFQQSRIYI